MSPAEKTATTVFDALTDFLVERPTLEQIIDYRLPEDMKQRALDLLEVNRERKLSVDEQSDMDDFMLFDHVMTLLRVKARLKQAGKR